MTTLPGILAEIAAVAGEDAALKIAAVRGGTQVYFPPVPSNGHWLCRLIGRDEAKAVCHRLTCGVGPLRAEIPTGEVARVVARRAKVDAMIREGRSERDIALATGYTGRAVRRRRHAVERMDKASPGKVGRLDKDRQLSLF